jgi:hypothetical protein
VENGAIRIMQVESWATRIVQEELLLISFMPKRGLFGQPKVAKNAKLETWLRSTTLMSAMEVYCVNGTATIENGSKISSCRFFDTLRIDPSRLWLIRPLSC